MNGISLFVHCTSSTRSLALLILQGFFNQIIQFYLPQFIQLCFFADKFQDFHYF